MVNVIPTTDKTSFVSLDIAETMDNPENESADYSYFNFEYDEYMYPGYSFERPFYLFIWEILVITTFLLNIVVLSVFIPRKILSPTIVIMSAIAISDSLTGLVTLPTYIMVFQRYEQATSYDDYLHSQSEREYLSEQSQHDTTNYTTDTPSNLVAEEIAPVDGYSLTKDLCRGFMISKFFLSTSFHTISIFLTLFLGIQRYVSMACPFKAGTFFSLKKTKIYCLAIFLLTPVLHMYHLFVEKAKRGMCQWELNESGCKSGCIYLWTAFVVRHFIPCCTFAVFTVLFILQLRKGERQFERISSCPEQVSTRIKENRRVSFIVTVIFIVRFVPEIPYSALLLYNGIEKTSSNGEHISLETNRVFHMLYEMLLMLSFQSNFFIYFIFNRKFRSCVLSRCIKYKTRVTREDGRNQYGRSVTQNSLTSSNTGPMDTAVHTDLTAVHISTHDTKIVAETEGLLHKVSNA